MAISRSGHEGDGAWVSDSKPADDGSVIQTERLSLRSITLDDAEFILRLLNDPDFLAYIGDRNVRQLADAEAYVRKIAQKGHSAEHCFLVVDLVDEHCPTGICTVLTREGLNDPDIGFAFLPEFTGRGFAFEAAQATMDYARQKLKIQRLVAITAPQNNRSIALLGKLGFRHQTTIQLDSDRTESLLFVSDRVQRSS